MGLRARVRARHCRTGTFLRAYQHPIERRLGERDVMVWGFLNRRRHHISQSHRARGAGREAHRTANTSSIAPLRGSRTGFVERLEERQLLAAVLVSDINPGAPSSAPITGITINNTIYFAADDGAHGSELWKSDGSTAGTSLVKDINPGLGASNPTGLTNINGILYFAANNGAGGMELWKSDGTAAGTVLVKDINAGAANSNPLNLINVNGTLFFQANTAANG